MNKLKLIFVMFTIAPVWGLTFYSMFWCIFKFPEMVAQYFGYGSHSLVTCLGCLACFIPSIFINGFLLSCYMEWAMGDKS
jgi:hypothetical protein